MEGHDQPDGNTVRTENEYKLLVATWMESRRVFGGESAQLDARIFDAALSNQCYRDILKEMRGSEANCLLDGLHAMIVAHNQNTNSWRCPRRQLLFDLSKAFGELPSMLYVHTVTIENRELPAGKGGFSDVFKGVHLHKDVAVKRLRSVMLPVTERVASIRRRLRREALAWFLLDHEFVLPFIGIDTESFGADLPCFVSPWMPNGNVIDLLREKNDENTRAGTCERLIHQILDGLVYLHSQQVAHGDLRGSNILVDQNYNPRLADFGLAALVDSEDSSTGDNGSYRWMAPELFNLTGVVRTFEADMYSFGCLCLELYTLKVPFHNIRSNSAVLLRVKDGSRPSRPTEEHSLFSDFMWDLVTRCWYAIPQERLTANDFRQSLNATTPSHSNHVIARTERHCTMQDENYGLASLATAGSATHQREISWAANPPETFQSASLKEGADGYPSSYELHRQESLRGVPRRAGSDMSPNSLGTSSMHGFHHQPERNAVPGVRPSTKRLRDSMGEDFPPVVKRRMVDLSYNPNNGSAAQQPSAVHDSNSNCAYNASIAPSIVPEAPVFSRDHIVLPLPQSATDDTAGRPNVASSLFWEGAEHAFQAASREHNINGNFNSQYGPNRALQNTGNVSPGLSIMVQVQIASPSHGSMGWEPLVVNNASSPGNLDQVEELAHVATVRRNISTGYFECRLCRRGYTRRFNLSYHVGLEHFGIKPFPCTKCDANFVRAHDATRHTATCERRRMGQPTSNGL